MCMHFFSYYLVKVHKSMELIVNSIKTHKIFKFLVSFSKIRGHVFLIEDVAVSEKDTLRILGSRTLDIREHIFLTLNFPNNLLLINIIINISKIYYK